MESDLKTVCVVMSAYNGEKYIKRQIDTIYRQKNVRIIMVVRDDGSTDNTIGVLKELNNKYHTIQIIEGENVGFAKSFCKALKAASEADYYAFSDQDDIWHDDKLIKGITELEKHNSEKPLLFYSNRMSVTENLEPIGSVSKDNRPTSRIGALCQNYVAGCVMLFNRAAKEILTKYEPNYPEGKYWSHDFWTGCLLFITGEVYYSDECLMDYVRYDNSVSSGGNIILTHKRKIKDFFYGKALYENHAHNLLAGYSEYFDDYEKEFLIMLRDYKKNFKYKLKIIFNKDFERQNLIGTIALKSAVLFNRFG